MEAPAIASQEQKVWRLACQTYPMISASARQGWNQDRVSNRPLSPSRGNTGSDDLWSGCFNDWIAATASEFRWTVRADPFFVFVSSIVRRSKCTCDHVLEYCSLSLIPV